MALNHYYLNAQNLSPETRDVLFDKIDDFSFLTTIDLNKPGCIEVFWDSKEDFKTSMNIPDECKITVICESE